MFPDILPIVQKYNLKRLSYKEVFTLFRHSNVTREASQAQAAALDKNQVYYVNWFNSYHCVYYDPLRVRDDTISAGWDAVSIVGFKYNPTHYLHKNIECDIP